MKQNLPPNQAILTVEQLDKEYPFVDLLLDTEIAQHIFTTSAVAAMTTQEKMHYIDNMNTERDIRNQIQFAADKGREEGKKKV